MSFVPSTAEEAHEGGGWSGVIESVRSDPGGEERDWGTTPPQLIVDIRPDYDTSKTRPEFVSIGKSKDSRVVQWHEAFIDNELHPDHEAFKEAIDECEDLEDLEDVWSKFLEGTHWEYETRSPKRGNKPYRVPCEYLGGSDEEEGAPKKGKSKKTAKKGKGVAKGKGKAKKSPKKEEEPEPEDLITEILTEAEEDLTRPEILKEAKKQGASASKVNEALKGMIEDGTVEETEDGFQLA